jgi:hypothetical protein
MDGWKKINLAKDEIKLGDVVAIRSGMESLWWIGKVFDLSTYPDDNGVDKLVISLICTAFIDDQKKKRRTRLLRNFWEPYIKEIALVKRAA